MSLKFNFQKFLSLILIFFISSSLIFPGIFLKPKEARGMAVHVTNWWSWIKHHAAHWAQEWAMHAKEWAEKLAVDKLKHHLIRMVVQEIVVWIIQGGKPHFITDLKSFLWDEINTMVGEAIWNSDLRWLCYPFSLKVRVLLPFSTKEHYPRCTLEDVIRNIEDFFNDFRYGSWIAWERVYVDPQNSYWGALAMAHDIYLEEFGREQEKRVLEAIVGDQFLGEKKNVIARTRCHQGCYRTYYRDCVEACLPTDEKCEEECEKKAEKVCCKSMEIIITPGKAFSHALFSAEDAVFKEISNIQSFTEAIPIIVDALVIRLAKEAKKGLLGLAVSALSSGGGGEGEITLPTPSEDYKEKMSDILNQRTYFDRKYAQKILDYDKKSLKLVKEEILPKLNFIKENCPHAMPNVERKISEYQKLSQDLENEINSIEEKLNSYEEIQQKIKNASTHEEVEKLVEEGMSLFLKNGVEPIYTQEKVNQTKEKYQNLNRENERIFGIYQNCSSPTLP